MRESVDCFFIQSIVYFARQVVNIVDGYAVHTIR